MTKVELIAAVANEANLTKKDAEAAVNSAPERHHQRPEGGRQGRTGRLSAPSRSVSALHARVATPDR